MLDHPGNRVQPRGQAAAILDPLEREVEDQVVLVRAEDAAVAFDPTQGNAPYVGLRFNTRGADRFEELTGRNVKRRMAIVLDDKVFSAPVINQRPITTRCAFPPES